MYRRIPAPSSAFLRRHPQVFAILALAIDEADRRRIDDREQDKEGVEVNALLLGPVDYSEQEKSNGHFSPVGRHHMEPLRDPVVLVG